MSPFIFQRHILYRTDSRFQARNYVSRLQSHHMWVPRPFRAAASRAVGWFRRADREAHRPVTADLVRRPAPPAQRFEGCRVYSPFRHCDSISGQRFAFRAAPHRPRAAPTLEARPGENEVSLNIARFSLVFAPRGARVPRGEALEQAAIALRPVLAHEFAVRISQHELCHPPVIV